MRTRHSEGSLSRKPMTVESVIGLAVVSGVLVFFAVGWIPYAIDAVRDRWETARFIESHRQVVVDRLAEPDVHAFAMRRDPENWGGLLIEVDVEDRAAFERLEADLPDAVGLRRLPRWEITVRSGEDLGSDLGGMAEGVAVGYEGIRRLIVALAVGAAAFGLVLVIGLYRRRRRSV